MNENDSKVVADMINDGTRTLVGDFTSRVKPLPDTALTPEDSTTIADMIDEGTKATLAKRRAEEDRIIRQNLINLR